MPWAGERGLRNSVGGETQSEVEEGRHFLEGSCENPCAAQGLVAIVEHPWGFGRMAHWWSQGQASIWGFLLKKYISASKSRRPDCNELNECGARGVSGSRRNVGFCVCAIRTLGSWASFNCHLKLPILPKNEGSEESY